MASLGTAVFRAMNQGHVWLYTKTNGRWFSMNDRLVILTTKGRVSGRKRSVPLMHVREGDSFVVTATAGGAPKHPGWYLNLVDDPAVEVRYRESDLTVRARITEGDERTALWNRFVEADARFAKYLDRTTREIPVVVLEPR